MMVFGKLEFHHCIVMETEQPFQSHCFCGSVIDVTGAVAQFTSGSSNTSIVLDNGAVLLA